MVVKGKKCKYCKHVYIKPCDGKTNDCANRIWKLTKGKIDILKLPHSEVEKIRKTGKLPTASQYKKLIEQMPKPRKPTKKTSAEETEVSKKRLVSSKPKRKRLKRKRLSK